MCQGKKAATYGSSGLLYGSADYENAGVGELDLFNDWNCWGAESILAEFGQTSPSESHVTVQNQDA